jgi:hypothetical protein
VESMKLVINPQTGKREDSKPENHRHNSHPKDSLRATLTGPNDSVPLTPQHKKRNLVDEKTNNKANCQESSEAGG